MGKFLQYLDFHDRFEKDREEEEENLLAGENESDPQKELRKRKGESSGDVVAGGPLVPSFIVLRNPSYEFVS